MSNKKKILIIEDDRVLADALKIEFEAAGFEVFVYNEGNGASEKTISVKPDLIILDLVLPGMHGFDILRILKGSDYLKHIPVIVASNLGEESDRKESMKLGAESFYVKAKVDLNDLLNKVHLLLK